MADRGTERREFFRIMDRLPIEFREVGREESLVLEKGFRGVGLGRDALSVPKTAHSEEKEIYLYLEAIDRKLDAVIDLLSRRGDRFTSVYSDVTISGSGLRFRSPVRFREGTYLELAVGLPVSGGHRVAALGRVLRSEPADDGQGGSETAVSFVSISEQDRDALVGYIFSRERESLRTRQRS